MYKIPFGFSFHLKKNIPMGAGLGGGSSNAASTLIGIDRLLGLKLKASELYRLGRQLGSDVNFFLSQSPLAFVEGRGDLVEPLAMKGRLQHYIIWPAIHLSTKAVYKAATVKLTKFFNNVKIMRYALARADIFLLNKSIFNALEQSAFNVCKQLQAVKKRLNESGIIFAMTGSGSAFFSIAHLRKPKERQAFQLMRSRVPKGWSVFCAQTF
jgi:4-diphosphocytidyl-2-C-methyl-D-erythritol kinase